MHRQRECCRLYASGPHARRMPWVESDTQLARLQSSSTQNSGIPRSAAAPKPLPAMNFLPARAWHLPCSPFGPAGCLPCPCTSLQGSNLDLVTLPAADGPAPGRPLAPRLPRPPAPCSRFETAQRRQEAGPGAPHGRQSCCDCQRRARRRRRSRHLRLHRCGSARRLRRRLHPPARRRLLVGACWGSHASSLLA